MIVKSDAVGKTLASWAGKAALTRLAFEESVRKFLAIRGFITVYTPHLFKWELQAPFEDWFGKVADIPFRFCPFSEENVKRRDEMMEYVVFGNKALQHVVMANASPISHHQLPALYAEIGEDYTRPKDRPGPDNHLAVWLTSFGDRTAAGVQSKLVHQTIHDLETLSLSMPRHTTTSCEGLAPDGQVQFVNKAGKKEDAYMIAASITFVWKDFSPIP